VTILIPAFCSFRISSGMTAFLAFTTEIAMATTSVALAYCRSFSICPSSLVMFRSTTTRYPSAAQFSSFSASLAPAAPASQNGELPFVRTMIRFRSKLDDASPSCGLGEPAPDGADESPPQPLSVPNSTKLADNRTAAQRLKRMTGLLRREAGKGRTISGGDGEFKVGDEATVA
jgi:hypothetical protein